MLEQPRTFYRVAGWEQCFSLSCDSLGASLSNGFLGMYVWHWGAEKMEYFQFPKRAKVKIVIRTFGNASDFDPINWLESPGRGQFGNFSAGSYQLRMTKGSNQSCSMLQAKMNFSLAYSTAIIQSSLRNPSVGCYIWIWSSCMRLENDLEMPPR